MCNQKSGSSFATGLLLGSIVGAGAALLFGTKKGKEIKNKIKKQYPEVFEKIEDKVEEVESKVAEVKKGVLREIKPLKMRFVRNGKKL